MNHDMPEHQGTFLGHALAGAMFLFLAISWIRAGAASPPFRSSLERRAAMALPIIGAVGELWWASWRLTDTSVINYLHAAMYLGFAVAAGIAALSSRWQLPERLSTA